MDNNDDKIFPAEFLSLTAEYHFKKYNPQTNTVYLLVVGSVLVALFSMFFIKVNINVKALGTIKSSTEHNEIKSLVSATVDSIFIKENQHITKGQILVRLRSAAINQQDLSARLQQREFEAQLTDLKLLVAIVRNKNWKGRPNLASALYGQQFVLLQQKARDATNRLAAANKDEERYRFLYKNKVVSASEYDAVHLTYQNARSALQLIYDSQAAQWEAALNELKTQMLNLKSQGESINQQKDLYTLRAPVSGTIQNLQGIQPGSVIAANELIAEISPETGMIGEVYVLPRDVGLIRLRNKVNFQVDAFNYNQWGLLTGEVLTISNDIFTKDGQQPYFKIRCKLDQNYLKLKNGYVGKVKNGMTLQANFFVTRRTLFQLLYDKADNWLNPGQLPNKSTKQT
ncbi:multidrug efflux pump subunit AcrA (membrane-fusion protein) [Pedobacter sp. UYEF25]